MIKIPEEVQFVLDELATHNFESYIVGGCVRDFLLGKKPNDWDVTTNAKPKEIQKIFPESVYKNRFGTVMVKARNTKHGTWNIVEVTTYRVDEKYTDKRHPDEIKFTSSLEEDLARRDFTVNAMAIGVKNQKSKNSLLAKNEAGGDFQNYEIIDLFKGQEDLKNKIIRTVGDPDKRFSEDALRMLRAVRLAVSLNFTVEKKLLKRLKKQSAFEIRFPRKN